jgi:hypothetical protein
MNVILTQFIRIQLTSDYSRRLLEFQNIPLRFSDEI